MLSYKFLEDENDIKSGKRTCEKTNESTQLHDLTFRLR